MIKVLVIAFINETNDQLLQLHGYSFFFKETFGVNRFLIVKLSFLTQNDYLSARD